MARGLLPDVQARQGQPETGDAAQRIQQRAVGNRSGADAVQRLMAEQQGVGELVRVRIGVGARRRLPGQLCVDVLEGGIEARLHAVQKGAIRLVGIVYLRS